MIIIIKKHWRPMEHESDNFTNRDCCFNKSHKRIFKGTGRLGNKGTSRDHLNNDTILERPEY